MLTRPVRHPIPPVLLVATLISAMRGTYPVMKIVERLKNLQFYYISTNMHTAIKNTKCFFFLFTHEKRESDQIYMIYLAIHDPSFRFSTQPTMIFKIRAFCPPLPPSREVLKKFFTVRNKTK